MYGSTPHRLSLFLLLLLCAPLLRAEVRLPRLIGDGMVLQRDTEVDVWGWADAGETVTVTFDGKTYPAEPAADGCWHATLPAHPAGGPYTMTVAGSNTIELSDILFGDVWLCSGQSNMEYSMGMVASLYEDEIAASTNDRIRQFNVPKEFDFQGPREDYGGGEWSSADPESVRNFTAVGYFFAREINERYDVPVGLINASLGGSPAEAWMTPEALRDYTGLYDDALRYRDTAYVSQVRRSDRERIGGWYAELKDQDAGYTGATPWSDPAADDADWSTTTLPALWNDTEAGDTPGSVWYRRSFEVPAGLTGKEVQLPFGNLIDADSVWINGTFVGGFGSRYVPRNYTVPAGILQTGENTIAVRVVSSGGSGGFIPEKTYALTDGTTTVDLSGEWQYRRGGEMDPLRGPTFIQWKPTGLYHAMIAPLLPYALKGVLWYQGESNVGRDRQYATLFPGLIENWREEMEDPDLPFLAVQLPNFGTPQEQPGESGWARMREAQEEILSLNNTGLATTIDIGEWNDIHPLNKLDVGKRLALLAQRDVYGDAKVIAEGPVYSSMAVKGNTAVLSFDHVGGGLESSDGTPLRHFAIAGADGEFVRAEARIEGETVVVSSPEVAAPEAVRYAWADAPEDINFYNAAGLPARPFRTDVPEAAAETGAVSSPDGRIRAIVDLEAATYTIEVDGEPVLYAGKLGVVREDGDFASLLRSVAQSEEREVRDSYTSKNAKKYQISYVANERTWHAANADGQRMDIVFRVADDGVAFRYVFPDTTTEVKKITREATTFPFRAGTRAWLQPKTEAQSGFEHTNPSYEAHYMSDIPVGTPAPGDNGWVYPALFRYQDTWILLTEADLGTTYCGTALQQYSPDGEYAINFPQEPEVFTNGVPTLNPESSLPWRTPWRIIALGDLATVQESTLGTDLAAPAVTTETDWIQPGKASWSWILKKDGGTVYDVQRDYIDFAADMDWQYCLIDASWDQTIGYDSVALLADYAKTKDVELLLWYNSAGSWNTVPFTPKDKLLTHESRMEEFGKLRDMGVRGIKVDFFGGDGQSMIAYYHGVLEDAAANGLLCNFHGATLPRGLHRTYPNYMTAEAVFGYEMITFGQGAADRAPMHMVLSAMIRNVYDPMDFTPVNLGGIPGRVERTTTAAYELATAVAMLSGIQHYAEQPEGMEKVPEYVRDFLRELPNYWEDVRFVDGDPNSHYVVARRHGDRWYVAGLNGADSAKDLELDLGWLGGRTGTLIAAGPGGTADDPSFREEEIQVPAAGSWNVSVGPKDGFVLVFEE
ncbi:glycosyl hydrolase family 2 [Neolewinella xylanilytica]|uniref:Glycosyl hydrolase family 2 n=1 Tax=Neolewinella xylanilytica TaxID=1514080 RepID=A0A2S6IAG9_9BACT|nr:glycoside hydrolase family 97 catalytic domain-containing protein [Neolewinella xylanilytica]PPK88472.1 glycosyl hydrolase family 2 [Neolewinella xylanilytica]